MMPLAVALMACDQGVPANVNAPPQPPAPAPRPCTREDDDLLLTVTNGRVIGCWSKVLDVTPPRVLDKPHLCLALPRGDSQAVSEPAPVRAPATELRRQGGATNVCIGATCKMLGANVTAALRRKSGPDLSATSDLEVLVTGLPLSNLRMNDELDAKVAAVNEQFAPTAWHVARDRRLQLDPPVHAKRGTITELEDIYPMGTLLVATWMNDACDLAGQCQVSTIVDASGTNRWTSFSQGQLMPLDDERVVVMPYPMTAPMTEHRSHTGERLGSLMLIDPSEVQDDWLGTTPVATRVDATTLVASWYSSRKSGWEVVLIATPVDQPPTITARQTIQTCP